MPPNPGDILSNNEICAQFRVGNSGGMRRSRVNNCLILISDPFKALYEDKWIDGVLHYTGMGQDGHQELDRQNRTLFNARDIQIAVYLFEVFEPCSYTYMGEVELDAAPYQSVQLGANGIRRNVWVFPLRIVAPNAFSVSDAVLLRREDLLAGKARKRNIADLANRARLVAGPPGTRRVNTTLYERNQSVVEYVLRLSLGVCQLCNQSAPFLKPTHEPYLEVHHVVWLSQHGEDRVANAVALCPNCHRKVHIVNDPQDNQHLQAVARENGLQLQA